MTAYEQRSYPGAAADTVLTADLALGGTAFSVTAGTGAGYPDGTGGPFFVIIDYDNSKAEKIRCSGRVNDTFTVAGTGGGRGQDGTTAVAHTAPAKVRAVWTATDAQESNRAAVNTIGRITSKGDLTPGSGANTTVRLAVGADGTLLIADSTQAGGVRWTSTGIVLDVTSTVGGVSGTQLAAARASWTAYTPTVSGLTVGNGTLAGHYLQIGKTVFFRVEFNLGTTSAVGTGPTIGTPVAGISGVVAGMGFHVGAVYALVGEIGLSANAVTIGAGSGAVTATVPFTWGSGDALFVSGCYEAA